jgi:hypothetical protein
MSLKIKQGARSIGFLYQLVNGINFSTFIISRSQMNGFTNSHIRTTPADITHGCIDVFIGGVGLSFQQRNCRHHLSALAITTLGNVHFIPGLLHGVIAVFAQPFNGSDLVGAHSGDRIGAGADSMVIHQHSAGAALGNTATKLGAYQVQFIAQNPQKRRIGQNIYGKFFIVDGDCKGSHGTGFDKVSKINNK